MSTEYFYNTNLEPNLLKSISQNIIKNMNSSTYPILNQSIWIEVTDYFGKVHQRMDLKFVDFFNQLLSEIQKIKASLGTKSQDILISCQLKQLASLESLIYKKVFKNQITSIKQFQDQLVNIKKQQDKQKNICQVLYQKCLNQSFGQQQTTSASQQQSQNEQYQILDNKQKQKIVSTFTESNGLEYVVVFTEKLIETLQTHQYNNFVTAANHICKRKHGSTGIKIIQKRQIRIKVKDALRLIGKIYRNQNNSNQRILLFDKSECHNGYRRKGNRYRD